MSGYMQYFQERSYHSSHLIWPHRNWPHFIIRTEWHCGSECAVKRPSSPWLRRIGQDSATCVVPIGRSHGELGRFRAHLLSFGSDEMRSAEMSDIWTLPWMTVGTSRWQCSTHYTELSLTSQVVINIVSTTCLWAWPSLAPLVHFRSEASVFVMGWLWGGNWEGHLNQTPDPRKFLKFDVKIRRFWCILLLQLLRAWCILADEWAYSGYPKCFHRSVALEASRRGNWTPKSFQWPRPWSSYPVPADVDYDVWLRCVTFPFFNAKCVERALSAWTESQTY